MRKFEEPEKETYPSGAVLDGYTRLMAAVLLQAVIDAKARRDAALRVEAITWLASPEAQALCEILELPDIFPAIMTGSKAPPKRGWRVNKR